MLSGKNLLLFVVLLTINNPPALAARNINPNYLAQTPEITVEKNPQFQFNQNETNEPLSLQELNKENKALKNDVSVLVQQINKLSQELNELRREGQKESPLAKTGGMFAVIFGSIIFMSILLAFLFYLKLRADSKREIKNKISDLIDNTKKEIEDSYKNQEDELDETISGYATSKINNFEEKIAEEYKLFSQKVEKEIEKYSKKIKDKIEKAYQEQESQFEENISSSLNHKINNFETKIVESSELYLEEIEEEMEKKFSTKKEDILKKIEEILPANNVGKMLSNLAEEKGLLTELNEELNVKVNELLTKETGLIYQEMEKKFAADIERLHLANAHFSIGNVLLKKQSYPEATLEFREAVKIKSDFYGAYINLGMALEKQEENEQAEKVYQDAINLRPDYFKAYFNLGNLQKKMGKYAEAIKNYQKVIELRPQDARAFNNLGTVQQLNGEVEAAKNNYREAISFDNNYVDAYFNLIFSEQEAEPEKIAEDLLAKNNAEEKTREQLRELIKQK